VLPISQKAVTDGDYKLVRLNRKAYTLNPADPASVPETDLTRQTDELYQIDWATPNPRIDRQGTAVAAGTAPLTNLTGEQQAAYDRLRAEMDKRDAVASYNYNYDTLHCPGDGNRDGVVDQQDLDNWAELSKLNLYQGVAQSSWYDVNHDGLTDAADEAIIRANLGKRCEVASL